MRKILFSFSWYVFTNRPVLFKLQKWIPLRVRVALHTLHKKNKNEDIFIKTTYASKKQGSPPDPFISICYIDILTSQRLCRIDILTSSHVSDNGYTKNIISVIGIDSHFLLKFFILHKVMCRLRP